MIDYTTALPTKPGRYFIRPADSCHQGKVVTVSEFGGDLVAWAGPDLYEFFRMAALDRVCVFVGEDRLEWAFIDERTDGEFNHWAPLMKLPAFPGECHAADSSQVTP